MNKSHSQAALVNSITEGIKLQSQNRPQRSRKNANESESVNNVSCNNTPNLSAPTTPNPSANAANQSDSSQSATGSLNSSSGGIANISQNANNISQPASSPAVSGKITILCKSVMSISILLVLLLYTRIYMFPFRYNIQKLYYAFAKSCKSSSETTETAEESSKL